MRVPSLYSLLYAPPKPLVDRHLRLEVKERVGADGEVIVPLDMDSLHEAINIIREERAEAVAVCLLHSYRYPRPRARRRRGTATDAAGSIRLPVRRRAPRDPRVRAHQHHRRQTPVSAPSSSRTPIRWLKESRPPVWTPPCASCSRTAASCPPSAPRRLLSRCWSPAPAAGVIAADVLGRRLGLKNIITFDMGGTTAKAALIENGSPSYTTDYEIGAGISLSSKLVTGGGHAVKVPVIDLAEVGAGGGSIVRVDPGGALRVGPNSAGSFPGPACYDTGGTDPTVTDANLVLGYINPAHLAGGEVALTPSLAESSMRSAVAGPLGISLQDAAHGVHAVANVNMIRAIRAVSTYRGRDPRDFALLAFGGSGPIHAADMARSLGIGTVVVPPSPGLFSAVGLLQARPERHFVRTYFTNVADADFDGINRVFDEFVARSTESMRDEGYDEADIEWLRAVDFRYTGQAHELTIPMSAQSLDQDVLSELVSSFHDEHDRTYGHKAEDEPTEIVNLRLTATCQLRGSLPTHSAHDHGSIDAHRRNVYFGPAIGTQETEVIDRPSLPASPTAGPLIIEEYDATTVIPPGCSACLDEFNNIVIDVGPN